MATETMFWSTYEPSGAEQTSEGFSTQELFDHALGVDGDRWNKFSRIEIDILAAAMIFIRANYDDDIRRLTIESRTVFLSLLYELESRRGA